MNHTVDTAFFPGWVRKSICFTIDDGNLQLDKKFLGYVKPAGIKGTFNLTTPLRDVGKETYLALYEGYEIANHCRYHAYCFNGRTEARPLKDQLFPAENPESADKTCMYPTGEKGVYRIHTYAWTYIADEDTY
ncbi:MAG: hypothetical protein MJ078_02580, partial [Clostridia bacterium]|nr:hypothetical protein [Clostridia bacterium]